jgi:hypothetical protein
MFGVSSFSWFPDAIAIEADIHVVVAVDGADVALSFCLWDDLDKEIGIGLT